MLTVPPQEALNKLLEKYQEATNNFFQQEAEKMFDIKKQELVAQLEEKRTEIILGMVRDISQYYQVASRDNNIVITIDERKLK